MSRKTFPCVTYIELQLSLTVNETHTVRSGSFDSPRLRYDFPENLFFLRAPFDLAFEYVQLLFNHLAQSFVPTRGGSGTGSSGRL